MTRSGLLPEAVIFMGPSSGKGAYQKAQALKSWNNILLPNLDESVYQTCKSYDIDFIEVFEEDVNAEACQKAICGFNPDVVVYSGVGGQIVSDATLNLGPKFLHMHSGWLPEFRGSTTVYYSLLEGKMPGVSAIILDRNIDTGPIIARRNYPRPSADINIDRIYDAAIRADLMVNVLMDYMITRKLLVIEHQNLSQSTPYYVIHPILKHLSILSVGEGRDSGL